MSSEENKEPETVSKSSSAIIQFISEEDGSVCGPQISIPSSVTVRQLQELLNKLLENETPQPYSFFLDGDELRSSLPPSLFTREGPVPLHYVPQATFRVRPVTRSAGTLRGHTNSVLCVQFSPHPEAGADLASGSGDGTVRLWDTATQTPLKTLTGHGDWVLAVSWSPDGRLLASGAKNGSLRIWDVSRDSSTSLSGHRSAVTSISWEPPAAGSSGRLVSAALDGTVKLWKGREALGLSGHTQGVLCVKWGGSGHIFTGGRDRTVNVYSGEDGRLLRTLRGHAHWVNCISLSSDYIVRKGATSAEYESFVTSGTSGGAERLVSGSDDGTLILWKPLQGAKPVLRMVGHQGPVMCCSFSPDGRHIASGSGDKSVKLWDGITGKYITTLRGHVGTVYQVAWSGDSRLLVSASKDSTMKLWDTRNGKLAHDLPGHADEVFAVDWSLDGEMVASGSFDRTLKIWKH